MSFSKPITPEEAKLTVLQFLGQNLGELKELDKRIINSSPQLRGININPQQVINSVAPHKVHSTNQAAQHAAPTVLPQATQPQAVPTVIHEPVMSVNNSILDKIYNKLCDIEKLLEKSKK